ncbi:MAG: CRISPR-associated helicase Cas3', partial [Nitrososphaerota archaeon]
MNMYDLLRAKSIKEEQPDDCNLLLKDHVIQVINRLEGLYEYAETNKNAISNTWLKEDKKKDLLFLAVAKALFIHDLGKIDAGFQWKLFNDNEKEVWNELRQIFNWDMFPKQKIKRHEYLSIFWSYILLDDKKEKEWNAKIRTAILFHHYNKFYTDSEKEFLEIIKVNQNASEDYLEFISNYKDKLEEFLKSIINEVKKNSRYDFVKTAMNELESDINFNKLHDLISEIKEHSPDIEAEIYDPETSKDETFVLMSGILKRCDHSASAEIPIEEIKDISAIFNRIKENITTNIKKISTEKSLWQEKILQNNYDYPLLIAPTGSGKTEFALFWASKQQRKLIYTLPLRVALNDLFGRFQVYAINSSGITENIVSLLHSTAFIEYLEKERSGSAGALIDQKVQTSKNLATPLILTTPDQILLTSLNFHGADRLKSTYPFAAIVVDEIQAYDPEMAAIIVKSLQDIRKLNGNILIMTATYPPYFEKFLTWFTKVEITNSQNIKNYDVKRHKIELVDVSLEQDDHHTKEKTNRENFKLSDAFQEKLESQIKVQDKNILVICNTVRKAIAIYDFLKESYPEEKHVIILHSRLIEGKKKEQVDYIKAQIKNKLDGKKSERIILVATQIVEASVDVDFDVLLTEISTIDSQIQRWGRVFRNRK